MANAFVGFLLILWALAGVVAFFWSLACLGKSGGSGSSKVLGLLIAIFFGPFWFLYKYLTESQNYCKNVRE
jgi:hypothetical protein